MFCRIEIVADYVGVIQGSITTCKLEGVDPYRYLPDVLQRLAQHPNSQIIELTPRV
jgi:hypothetical protein